MKTRIFSKPASLLLPLLVLLACSPPDTPVNVIKLTCENQVDPSGIGVQSPQLGWISESSDRGDRQTAYRIIVASSTDLLAGDEGDLWDSGKQEGDQSLLVPYAGKQLVSGQVCYWKVKVWDKDGNASSWSETGTFSMGLLDPGDWLAKWIGTEHIFPGEDTAGQFTKVAARYLRKEFDVTGTVKRAVAYISGLGLNELHINGSKTGDLVLAPDATDYTKTVFYNTFDVTSQLRSGKNAIGVILGNGRYLAMRKDEPFLMQSYGLPKLLMQIDIEYNDGTHDVIVSDNTWKLTPDGPITENNEFDGEKYDARLEMDGWDEPGFTDLAWLDADITGGPAGKLSAPLNEPIRITGHITPVSVKKAGPDVWIYDMGQNMVGWVSVRAAGTRGKKVTLRFAETLKPGGSLYLANIRSAKVTDSYVFKGDGTETWEPAFTYHGFRYVEVSGLKDPGLSAITGCIVNNDLASNGSFECSDTMINHIYRNATWGIRGNYRSFPTDCPQRDERMGWLGDRATGCRGESYIFNNNALYRKWMGDIRDAQNEKGSIPDVCPAYWAMYNDNVTWDGTGIMILDMLLSQYGNTRALDENYDAMKKWIMYMYETYSKDGLMPRDTYGDWCMPPEEPSMIHSRDPNRITAGPLLGTSYFCHDVDLMKKFALILNKPGDARYFEELSARMKKAYNDAFFDETLNCYGNNTVTANIISLAFGLVPEKRRPDVFNNIVEQIETEYDGHIPVGLIGITNLQRVLSEFGRADIAMRFATDTTYPGWGYMVKNGATTIWELWNGNTADPSMNSGNHVMLLGDLIIWMHECLGGIMPDTPGFKTIIMKPLLAEGLGFVKTRHNSPYGLIVSNWEINDKKEFHWDIDIPFNTKATVFIPATDASGVLENGRKPSKKDGITFTGFKNGFAMYEVLSGRYHFESPGVSIPQNNDIRSSTVNILPEDKSTPGGILVTMTCKDTGAEIRYTLDGTEPGINSHLYSAPFEIKSPCAVKARSFKEGVDPGYVTGRNYDIYNAGENKLNYEYFEGKWDSLPDFALLNPLRKGVVNGFRLADIKPREDYYGIRFTGFIEIPSDGIYSFSTLSDDGSRLSIGGVRIVDNDGIHGPFTVRDKANLKKGRHALTLDFFEGNYGEILRVEIEGPDLPRQPLPVSMLSAR